MKINDTHHIPAGRHPPGSSVRVRFIDDGAAYVTITTVGNRGGVNTGSIVLTAGEVRELAEALSGVA